MVVILLILLSRSRSRCPWKKRKILILVIMGVFVTGSKSNKKASEEDLYGTWVNEDYLMEPLIGGPRSKLIIKHDGTIENYGTPKSYKSVEVKREREPWAYNVTDSWVDSEKNSWYKIVLKRTGTETFMGGAQYCLFKLGNSKSTLEYTRYSIDYPTEIDPNSLRYTYRIYYRQ